MLIHPDNPDTSTEPGGGRSHCGPWSRLLPRPGLGPPFPSCLAPFHSDIPIKGLVWGERFYCPAILPALLPPLRVRPAYYACRPVYGLPFVFIVHAPDCWTWQTEKLGFKKARSDPDSFDLHSTEITMLASRAADWTLVFQLQSSLMAASLGFGRLMELGF